MMNAEASPADSGFDHSLALRTVLAQNIRLRAQALDFRLNAVADMAGVSRSQFYNVLRLNSSPSLDWVAKVAHVLLVPPAALLSRQTPMQNAGQNTVPQTNGGSGWTTSQPQLSSAPNFAPYPGNSNPVPPPQDGFGAPYPIARARHPFPEPLPFPPPRPLNYR